MNVISKLFLAFSLCLVLACHQADVQVTENRITLNGNWKLTESGKDYIVRATVPGTVHTDLLKAGQIPDPFYRNNEDSLRYLEDKNWRYTRTFYWMEVQQYEIMQLVCEGLDTYAEIKINGQVIGRSNNMHKQWVYDLSGVLKNGENQIEIIFSSPLNYNREAAERLGYVLPADNEEGALKFSPFCRKAAFHFGWDWAPRMITSGIWKDIFIRWSNDIIVEDYAVRTLDISGDSATMSLNVHYYVAKGAPVSVRLGEHQFSHVLTKGVCTIRDTFTIPNPNLWWPNGSGQPYMYEDHLIVTAANDVVYKKNIKYGVRTIELVHDADSIGTSFYFKVNGKPIFAKGANYIPQDVFIPRVKDEQYRHLLTAAQDAGMNMLRVWGGGIYEKDIFYELCDSLGLMVWQDFMFAGTMYPIDGDFISNVESEIRYQLKRLGKHPSLAIWCGNNEIEVAWHNWGWQDKYGYTEGVQKLLWSRYELLFEKLIPQWIEEVLPGTAYTATSPLSNWGSPENFNHGTMHYWGVWHGGQDIASFSDNVGRFMVEYGMQSYPEMGTIRLFATDDDLELDSDIMRNRQKSYIGNKEILRHIEAVYGKPQDFEDFVDKSQEVQASALELAIASHIESEGHCMGSLLWQLNDCWPGPSWSIVDYFGKKKKAYQSVKGAFDR